MGRPLAVVLLWALIQVISCQNQRPVFQQNMNGLSLREDTQVGHQVYVLQATDGNGDELTYSIDSPYFEVPSVSTGEVFLQRPLDFESEARIEAVVSVNDGTDTVTLPILVTVTDINDQSPTFTVQTFDTIVAKESDVGTVLFDNIVVQDGDTVNPILEVRCFTFPGTAQDEDACRWVRVVPLDITRNTWTGRVEVGASLQQWYDNIGDLMEISLEATDGLFTERYSLVVEISDVPANPPVFTGVLVATVRENAAVDTEVLTIEAFDGDRGNARAIRYSLVSNPGNFFRIDPESGMIRVNRQLDREDSAVRNGAITLVVMAGEVLGPGLIGSESFNSANSTVIVTIMDVNDNGPRFDPDQYTSPMVENLATGSALPDLVIRVFDSDDADNAEFALSLLDYNDIFEIQPAIGRGSVQASILVKNTDLVDYDEGRRQYVLRLRAVETQTSERRTGTATVTVNIADENDNPPLFSQSSYAATISELASPGTNIITIMATDKDSNDFFGVDSIRYKVEGPEASLFKCDRLTGHITVAYCDNPGTRPCLDAEARTEYALTFYAADSYSEGFLSSVPLTINLLDENDNPPLFRLPEYVSYITEGETEPVPSVQVEALDDDSTRNGNNRITYSIVGGNPRNLWQVSPQTGVITASQPVDYESVPGDQGMYLLTVQAQDPDFTDTTTVKIFVLDTNDHPPAFSNEGFYEQFILENTLPETVVETVTATDNDSPLSPNGQVRYRITAGARSKFDINDTSGVITVAEDATFDFDVQRLYNMTVLATDQGQPQMTAVATVFIHILDANNKNPYFQPSTVRVDISEDTPIRGFVVTMTAKDPDSNADLRYIIVNPVRAWDGQNREIIPNTNYMNLFDIGEGTGEVTVFRPLERDRVARWSAAVRVTDATGGPEQTATGTVIINILEVNDRPPVFGPPWSPDNPFIDISVREEQSPGSHVTTIVAADPTDGIDRYELISNPGGYFRLDRATGVITIERPIDYEQIQSTTFVVVAIDDGQPSQSATATINVAVENINDEFPIFSQTNYEIAIPENAPEGFSVVQVSATDLDRGTYGIVQYDVVDPQDRFTVDPSTGLVRVKAGAVLDREENPLIAFNIRAFDSPNDEDARKYTTVPVYITLLDEDDNPPTFTQSTYTAVVVETAPRGSSVIQLVVIDDDEGDNAVVIFQETGGDAYDLFRVDQSTGLITTSGPLTGRAGIYNLTVIARGPHGGPVNMATVTITVLEAVNSPPRWIFPNTLNETVEVLENQGPNYVVVQVTAIDSDTGANGRVTYGFEYNGQSVQEVPGFTINPITGVIQSTESFDREQLSSYTLYLIAQDSGNPIMEAKQRLIVNIIDVNDNYPEFPLFRNCCVIPMSLSVLETEDDTFLGQIIATDRDGGESAEIVYEILSGNVGGVFELEPETGRLLLVDSLDREVVATYTLLIRATNKMAVNPEGQVQPKCHANCTDPSTLTLIVHVLDVNDVAPDFGGSHFNACVSVDATIGTLVHRMVAVDPDEGLVTDVIYEITSQNNFDSLKKSDAKAPAGMFEIGVSNGSVYNRRLLTPYEEHYFDLGVSARDPADLQSSALLRIWVTPPSKEVKVTVREELDYVKENIDILVAQISESTGMGIVCVNDIRYHRTGGGDTVTEWTDLYIHVINPETYIIYDPNAVMSKLNGTGIVGAVVVASTARWDGFYIDPVLIAIIIILILLLIALIALCCLCWCWGALFGTSTRYEKEALVLNAGTINPLWKGYEDQELSMAVPDMEQKIELKGYINQGFAANEALSHNQYQTETHAESHFMASQSMSNGQASGMNGAAPQIEADLLRTTSDMGSGLGLHASGAGAGTGAGGYSNGRLLSTSSSAYNNGHVGHVVTSHGTMTDAADGDDDDYPAPNYHEAGIGATLSRGEYVEYSESFLMNSAEQDLHGDLRTIGVQTLPGGSRHPSGHPALQAPHIRTDLIVDEVDLPTDSSLATNTQYGGGDLWGEEFPEGMYQGEIHLGSLRPTPGRGAVTSVSSSGPGGAPRQYQEMQQTHYEESQHYEEAYEDDYSNRGAMNIQYIQ